ncbi:MAG TPA: ShlB/FhaC/HecB family hemolysin secretion/activation protein, partial [Steroidobacteraceae bacterium]
NTQSADRSVVPILRAGPIPGTVDLAFKVDDHLPLHGSVEFNNQATPDTESLRLNLSVQYANLFADFDSISVQYQDAPQKFGEAAVFAINYASRPVFMTWRPSLYFIDSNSNVSTIGTLGVVGKGQIAGVRMSDVLQADSGANQAIVFGVDYKHFRQTIDLAAASALDTPITYLNLSTAYSGSWHANKLFETLNLSVNFGPRGIASVNGANEFENDRLKSRANYFYLRGDGSLSWGAPLRWRLTLRAAGQYTREPLITNEDYSIAGVDGVRGYLEAEVLADTAVKGTAQLQVPTWRLKERNIIDGFVFFDDAHGSMLDALPGEPTYYNLRSTGAGVDLFPGGSYFSSVVWALPLVDGSRTRRHDSRVLFLVRGSF